MKLVHLSLVVVALGLSLLILSFLWPRLIGTTVWTEKQAVEFSEASHDLHRLSHAHPDDHKGERNGAHEPDQLEAARERYERSQAELRRARSLRSGIAAKLKWTGVVFSLLGAAGYFFATRSAGE